MIFVYKTSLRLLRARAWGGHPPSKIRACGRLFLWIAAIATARIGSIEVGFLSVRIAGVSPSIRRGVIVDCGGCLAVRMLVSVGYRVGNEGKKKKKDPRLLVSP